MKIEQFLYGMFDGKIHLFKSPEVNKLLTDKNFQYLRNLTVKDSDHYLWLPTEQVVAIPHIREVNDGNGREWVVNHTLLIRIHDYLRLTEPLNQVSRYFIRDDKIPENFDSIEVNANV